MPQTIDMETAAQKSSSQFADDSSYSLQPFFVDTSQESAATCMDHDVVKQDAKWCCRKHYWYKKIVDRCCDLSYT